MLAALVTTLLFATSAVCGYRTAKQTGGIEANFWRITLATIFLTVWAFTFGAGFAGAPEWFTATQRIFRRCPASAPAAPS
jgi:hypothetical protein